jgi:hypothetical protein
MGAIPKLAVGGLGLSTLIKGGENKTMEELDVEATIA